MFSSKTVVTLSDRNLAATQRMTDHIAKGSLNFEPDTKLTQQILQACERLVPVTTASAEVL